MRLCPMKAISLKMIKSMIVKYLVYSISITFFSWIAGMIVNAVIRKKSYYKNLSNLDFIQNESLTKSMGLGVFKWVVKNTFFKYFNQNIKLKNKAERIDLNELRKEMTFSEVSHLIGFGCVAVYALVTFIYGDYLFGLIILIVNVFMNLYPSLLQQENKRRIDRLIKNYC